MADEVADQREQDDAGGVGESHEHPEDCAVPWRAGFHGYRGGGGGGKKAFTEIAVIDVALGFGACYSV